MSTSPSTTTQAVTTWQIDPAHTTVGFSGKHMMFTTVRGRFKELSGTVVLDEANPANSKVEVEIAANSLDTGVEQRDTHLRSADFLEVENNPKITFKSTRVEPVDGQRARVFGELTIRGVTREVELDTILAGKGKNPWGKEVVGFEASTTINRKDFGLTWNVALETGGFLVSDKIDIDVDAQLVKQD